MSFFSQKIVHGHKLGSGVFISQEGEAGDECHQGSIGKFWVGFQFLLMFLGS